MSRLTGRRVVVGAAVCSVAFAAWYGYAPSTVPPTLRAAGDAVGDSPGVVLVAVGAVAGVLGLLYAWLTGGDAEAPLGESEPKRTRSRATVAGDDLSITYEQAVESGGPDDPSADPIRRRLRTVVVESHRAADQEDPTAHIDKGAWTDDRYAAAFLSETTAVDYPWYHRLYAWLYPDRAYERRVTRALDAVERACEDRLPGFDAPVRERDAGRLRALGAAVRRSLGRHS